VRVRVRRTEPREAGQVRAGHKARGRAQQVCAAGAQQARAVPWAGRGSTPLRAAPALGDLRESQRTFEFKIQRAFIQSVRSALKYAQVPGAGAAVCFPSCPRHSARLLRACRAHLLRAPQPTVARGAHLASVPGSLHRMHMRTARRHAEQAHALGRDAPTCFLSDPVKVHPATDPACHGLPPPRLLAFSCASPPRDPGWFSLSSHALFAPATPCPHPLPVCTAAPERTRLNRLPHLHSMRPLNSTTFLPVVPPPLTGA
jgi:hypothetical protein